MRFFFTELERRRGSKGRQLEWRSSDELRGQFPGNVVIRFTASFRKILRSEQIDGVIPVWLVEPNNVTAPQDNSLLSDLAYFARG